ncbi:MAG: hypothetical protein JW940_33945 [Polyangiaceae bacterium]|nr:hypothetical protein [Polyangiaceae bacterium]
MHDRSKTVRTTAAMGLSGLVLLGCSKSGAWEVEPPPASPAASAPRARSITAPASEAASADAAAPVAASVAPEAGLAEQPDPFELPATPQPQCPKQSLLFVQREAGYRKVPLGLERVWDAPQWRCLRAGEKFWQRSAAGNTSEALSFTVLRVLDASSVEVGFGEAWVVVGEAIAYPSQQNPKRVSSEGVCFRMRVFDGGADLCLMRVAGALFP